MKAHNGWKRAASVLGYSIAAFLFSFGTARGDAVLGWSTMAGYLAAVSERNPAQAASDLAAVQTAMFETMNFVQGKYVPRFLVRHEAALSPSSEAEAIGAAHYVLSQLYPERVALLDVALECALFAFPDHEAATRARIWGRHLGGNVYAALRANADVQRKAGTSRSSSESTGMAWSSGLIQLVQAKTLAPIERARILTLASLAVSDVYAAAEEAKASSGLAPCLSCAIGAAVRVILEAEFAPETLAEGGVTKDAVAGWMRVRSDAVEPSDDPSPERTGEEVGRRIGLQTLRYYRPVR